MDPKKLKPIFLFFEKKTKYKVPFIHKLIYDQESLTKEDLDVKKGLDLGGTKILKLPDNLKVGGSLFLHNTKITSLPDNLEVGGHGGNLDLFDTKISSLPKNLKVGGSLYLEHTPLSKKYTFEEIKKMVPGVKGKIYL